MTSDQESQLRTLTERVQQLERELAETRTALHVHESLLSIMPLSIFLYELTEAGNPNSLRLIAASDTALQATRFTRDAIGKPLTELFPWLSQEHHENNLVILANGQPVFLGEIEGYDERTQRTLLAKVTAIPLSERHLCILTEDISDMRQKEEILRQSILQTEMIKVQQAMLAELSTPLIPITDHVMVMPLIGSVDSRRANQVLETLLSGIESSRTKIAILDITGVPIVDTQVANAFIRAAQAVKLLGAQIILTGIRPEVAQTLVGLGTELNGIITQSSLQNGIAFATRQR